jgi:hypothetical protein
VLASLLTTRVTFVPCFLFILLGTPHIERLRGNHTVSAALTGITTAVVGVIANLGLYFAVHTLFATVRENQPRAAAPATPGPRHHPTRTGSDRSHRRGPDLPAQMVDAARARCLRRPRPGRRARRPARHLTFTDKPLDEATPVDPVARQRAAPESDLGQVAPAAGSAGSIVVSCGSPSSVATQRPTTWQNCRQ